MLALSFTFRKRSQLLMPLKAAVARLVNRDIFHFGLILCVTAFACISSKTGDSARLGRVRCLS